MNKKNIAIIGATGYAGEELLRILLLHPSVHISGISSESFQGKKICEVYPSLSGFCELTCVSADEAMRGADVIFAALPHGLSQPIAQKAGETGAIFIDLGADFRLNDEEDYKKWYGLEYNEYIDYHHSAVYSIPELHRESLKTARIIGNPGCYPTSIALALAPAAKAKMVSAEGIIADSKSGATGAGRALTLATHFTECNEAFSAYKIAAHRHTPEIEQTASELFGENVKLTFVPHLLPINRGILSTVYSKLIVETTVEKIHSVYKEFYRGEKFVRVLPLGETANLKNVKYSNFCDISLHLDQRTKTLIVCSAIDNMVKGAAGQAVQNMNILCGFGEEAGLNLIPPAF